jgi:hypothetical protein
MKARWIGHFLRQNYIIKRVIEGKIEGMGKPRRRRKQLRETFRKDSTGI